MKAMLVIITLFLQTGMYAQYFESNKYRFVEDSHYPELEIKINEEWQSFNLLDEIADLFHYECDEIELNGKGSKELIVRWSNAVYGSGGGSTTKGIQVWDLDNGIRLLNEIVSCSDESFGRDGVSAYFIECKKPIEFVNQAIKIYKENCESNTDDVQDIALECKLTAYDEGEYIFVNGKIEKK